MIDKLRRAADEYGMLDCDSVTVALSGGADSTALLAALSELKREYGYRLYAAHLNHMIRGKEADEDEEFCRALCESLGVELVAERIDVPSEAKKRKIGTELAAREIRYDFLNRRATGRIATAHTADDNLETVILNLCRGTGLAGLTGIPPVRGRMIRPLIYCTREDTEGFCRSRGLEFRVDSTNLTDEYKRNFIRHNIVPLMKEINPRVSLGVEEGCMTLAEDRRFIENAAKLFEKDASVGKKGFDAAALGKGDPALSKRVIISAVKDRCGTTPDRKTAEGIYRLCLTGGGRLNFHGNCFATVSHGLLTFSHPEDAAATPEEIMLNINELAESARCLEKACTSETGPENNLSSASTDDNEGAVFRSGNVLFSVMSAESFYRFCKVHKKLLFTALDCDKISGAVKIRSRKEGDTVRPAGRGCTKSLKKLFCELKIPVTERNSIRIIEDDRGIAAVCGYAADERVAIDAATKQVLVAQIAEE